MYDPHLHLLIDDGEIDYRRGLTRFIESPQRLCLEPVLRPEEPLISMDCCLPVAMSLAETLRMPLASISKETSIWGTPRGAGAIPVRLKRPSVRLS